MLAACLPPADSLPADDYANSVWQKCYMILKHLSMAGQCLHMPSRLLPLSALAFLCLVFYSLREEADTAFLAHTSWTAPQTLDTARPQEALCDDLQGSTHIDTVSYLDKEYARYGATLELREKVLISYPSADVTKVHTPRSLLFPALEIVQCRLTAVSS